MLLIWLAGLWIWGKLGLKDNFALLSYLAYYILESRNAIRLKRKYPPLNNTWERRSEFWEKYESPIKSKKKISPQRMTKWW